MTDKKRMSLVPPTIKTDDKLDDFIHEPEKKRTGKQGIKTYYPWEREHITDDNIKTFVLRLPFPDKLRAKYIVDNSLQYKSLHDFFKRAILSQIHEDLVKLGVYD